MTVQTPPDTHRDQRLSVASARGYLYDLSEQIDGASKDADGLHVPLGDRWLHLQIIDVSEPRSAFGYRYALVGWTGGPHEIPGSDPKRFSESRGRFERDDLTASVQEALRWASAVYAVVNDSDVEAGRLSDGRVVQHRFPDMDTAEEWLSARERPGAELVRASDLSAEDIRRAEDALQ